VPTTHVRGAASPRLVLGAHRASTRCTNPRRTIHRPGVHRKPGRSLGADDADDAEREVAHPRLLADEEERGGRAPAGSRWPPRRRAVVTVRAFPSRSASARRSRRRRRGTRWRRSERVRRGARARGLRRARRGEGACGARGTARLAGRPAARRLPSAPRPAGSASPPRAPRGAGAPQAASAGAPGLPGPVLSWRPRASGRPSSSRRPPLPEPTGPPPRR